MFRIWISLDTDMGGASGGGQSGGGVPAGGQPSAQAATLAALNQGGGAVPAATLGAGQQGAAPAGNQQQASDFANSFLSQVDPAHRAIVEPYIQRWDAGVTRRFQDLHGQLQPFTQLGADPQTLQQAYQLYQMIDNDPGQVISLLQELVGPAAGDPTGTQSVSGQQQVPSPAEGQVVPPGLTPEIQAQLDKIPMFEQVLELLAGNTLQQQQTQQAAAEDAQLENYMGLLKQEYGQFDEDYVIAKMLAGMDGEQAVQAFQQSIQGGVNARAGRPNVPPVLGGGGSVPSTAQRITGASRKDTKGLVANILAASNQG